MSKNRTKNQIISEENVVRINSVADLTAHKLKLSFNYGAGFSVNHILAFYMDEAARCLDDGIISSARDGDIGAIFGIGFAPFRGGPFRYMDSLGIDSVVSKLKSYQARFGDRFEPCRLLETMADEGKTFYS